MVGSEDEMFCPSCGKRISHTANFCRHCGEPNRKRTQDDDGEREERRQSTEPTESQNRGAGPKADWPGESWDEVDWGDDAAGVNQPEHADSSHSRWYQALPASLKQHDEPPVRTVGIAVGLAITGILLLVLLTTVTVVVGISLGFSATSTSVLGTILGQYVGFAGLALYYLRYRGFGWDQIKQYLGVRFPTVKEVGLILGSWILILILSAVVGLAAMEFLPELLGTEQPDEPAENVVEEILANNPEILPAAILVMFLVVGPCEELLFRGVVQGRLRERLAAVPAILIATTVFALVHVVALVGSLDQMLIALSVLFVTSLVLGAVYEYTENIVVVSLLHGFHNSMVSIFVYVDAVYEIEGVITPLLVLVELL